MMSRPIVYASH